MALNAWIHIQPLKSWTFTRIPNWQTKIIVLTKPYNFKKTTSIEGEKDFARIAEITDWKGPNTFKLYTYIRPFNL